MYNLVYDIANPFTEAIDNIGLGGLTEAIGWLGPKPRITILERRSHRPA